MDIAPTRGPLPLEWAISREEEAILWRSVDKIPEVYREPLGWCKPGVGSSAPLSNAFNELAFEHAVGFERLRSRIPWV